MIGLDHRPAQDRRQRGGAESSAWLWQVVGIDGVTTVQDFRGDQAITEGHADEDQGAPQFHAARIDPALALRDVPGFDPGPDFVGQGLVTLSAGDQGQNGVEGETLLPELSHGIQGLLFGCIHPRVDHIGSPHDLRVTLAVRRTAHGSRVTLPELSILFAEDARKLPSEPEATKNGLRPEV